MSNKLSKINYDGKELLINDINANNSINKVKESINKANASIDSLLKSLRRKTKLGYSLALNSIKVINIPHSKTSDVIDLSYNYSIDVSRTIYAITVVLSNSLPAGSGSDQTIMTTFVFSGRQLIEETGMSGTNSAFNLVNHYGTDNDGYISVGLLKSKSGNQYWQNFFKLHVYNGTTEVTDKSTVYAVAYTFQSNHLPYYYYNYLPSRINTIKNLDNTIKGHGDSLVFLTDPHMPNNNNFSPSIISYIVEHSDVNKVILGGDYCNEPFSTNATFNQIADNVDKYKYLADTVYFVRGNHDSGQYGNGDQLTPTMLYSILCDDIEGMPITAPILYSYHNNNEQKIRYFILDSGNDGALDSDQVTWLTQKSHELSSDWTIVIFVHQGIGDDTEGDTKNVYLYTSGTQIKNALAGCAAHVAGVICGHMHIDLNYSVGNYSFVTTTCDNLERIFSKHKRDYGTITEQAFDVVHIDTKNKKLYFTRIGGGISDPSANYAINDRVFTYV